MNRSFKPLAISIPIIGLIVAGYLSRGMWQAHPVESTTKPEETHTNSDKIIVGDLAQKNLNIVAKPLKAEVFWKTITVQGMVVDRPGISDREIVAPAIGIVSKIVHVPGDVVHPGDVLFVLKLASDAIHQTQTDLLKATQDIKLAEAKRKRISAAGEAIAGARVIEIDSEISRLEVSAQAYRQELTNRGFSSAEIEGIADGKLLSEISVSIPSPPNGQPSSELEVQELKVELGEQIQAGQELCHISNHRTLAIEGRAFRDETSLLERSVKEGLPVEVDFQEDAAADWPPFEQSFSIRYLANTIDPTTRTFSFLMPLENQSKSVERGDKTHLLWRFRPGQKVQIRIPTEKLDDVFVLPADAVVTEGGDAFIFTQNVNTFERKAIHVLFRDRDQVVIANDGSIPTYVRGQDRWTIPAVVRGAGAQLNRMAKGGSSGAPKGYHIHADGSLHKNEDEGK